MNYNEDKRIVLTLDAGGTNFVFSAIQGCEEIVEPIRLDSEVDDLDKCLRTLVKGFKLVQEKLDTNASAISFAFPGPADYPKGIIGDLPNLPAFRGGTALGPYLQKVFDMPVFINNDGNLYAYGEALFGYLPYINSKLKEAGSSKQYKNLVAFTLGTGFGGGIVINGELVVGDNSNAGEVWLLRDINNSKRNVEESIAIRAVKREYEEITCQENSGLSPKDIFEIAMGEKEGNKEAAKLAFHKMGTALGEAISIMCTTIDGLIVIGGGISGASELFLDAALEVMNSKFPANGNKRLVTKNYNLEKAGDMEEFLKDKSITIDIPVFGDKITYDNEPKTGVAISKIGTSKAIAIGAYAFALHELDKK